MKKLFAILLSSLICASTSFAQMITQQLVHIPGTNYLYIASGADKTFVKRTDKITFNGVSKQLGSNPAFAQEQADWSEKNNVKYSFIKNKPTKLSQFTNDIGLASTNWVQNNYYDKTTTENRFISTNELGNGNLSIKMNGTEIGSFDANSKTDVDVNIPIGTGNLSIKTNGTEVGSFNANTFDNVDVDIPIGTAQIDIKKNDSVVGSFGLNDFQNQSITIPVGDKDLILKISGQEITKFNADETSEKSFDVTIEALDIDNTIANYLSQKYGLSLSEEYGVVVISGYDNSLSFENNTFEFTTNFVITSTNGTINFETPSVPQYNGHELVLNAWTTMYDDNNESFTPDGEEPIKITTHIDDGNVTWVEPEVIDDVDVKTLSIGIGETLAIHYENETDEWPYEIDKSKEINHYFDLSENASGAEDPYSIKVPASSMAKNDKLTLYLHQAPSIFTYYDIEPDNISKTSYPRESFWLEDEEDGIWTFELKSPPGCTDWNISQYTKRDIGTFVEWIINDEGTIIGYNPSTLKGRIRIPASVNGTNVVALDDELFLDQTEVTYFELPEGLQVIKPSAFQNTSITEIVFPESLIYINSRAFAGCTKLEEITLGNNIDEIGQNAFIECPLDTIYFTRQEDESHDDAVQRIYDWLHDEEEIDEDIDPYYCDITPVEWNWEYDEENGTITHGYPPVTGERVGAVIIPSEIDGVKFTVLGDGNNIIDGNNKQFVTKLDISDGIERINAYLTDFKNARIIKLPKTLEAIGEPEWFIAEDYKLKRIYIPENVVEIGIDFGYECENLKEITVSKKNPYYMSQDGILFTKDMSLLMTYPMGKTNETYEIPNGVSTIGYDAFYLAKNLTNIIIPETVVKLDNYAFYNSGLKEIYIPDTVVDFGDYESESYTFGECYSLEKVRLPQNMSYIPYSMFSGCGNLTEIEIPDSIETIYSYAFSGTGITEFEWPEVVTEIRDGMFEGCQSLSNIVIPNTVTSMGSYLFSEHTKLVDVTIPASVESIGDEIFRDCTTLTNVVFEGDIESIGEQTFLRCENLMNVYFPEKNMDDVQNMDNYPWSLQTGCRIHCKDGTFEVPQMASLFYFKDGTVQTIWDDRINDSQFGNNQNLTNAVIGNVVTSIGNRAFYNCDSLTSITIFNNVESIGNEAFQWCDNLTTVTVLGNITNDWNLSPFMGCQNLTTVVLGGRMTKIPKGIFSGCNGLKDVTIGNSVTGIGLGAFSDCRGLASVTIPDSVTSIGDYAFQYCRVLTNVVLSDNLQELGEGAFAYCNALSMNIPNSVTHIGRVAFIECSNLTSVTIPDGVTSIGDLTFNYCSNLTEVTIGTGLTSIEWGAFLHCSSLTTISYSTNPGQLPEDRKQEIISMLSSSSFNTSQITTWNVVSSE